MSGRRAPGVVVVLTVLALCATAPAHGKSFVGLIGRDTLLRPLATMMRDTLARSVPIPAASPGVTFVFDPDSGAFERETTVAGQVFMERAQPLGRGKWNLSVAYEYVHLDTLDGQNLKRLSDTSSFIVDPDGRGFINLPHLSFDIAMNQVALGATYGVTDDLDVSMTLPLLDSTFEEDRRQRNFFDGRTPTASVHASATGVGDLLLRAKYRALHGAWGDVAAGLGLRAPTGNEDDFQGIGVWEVSPALYGSSPSWPVTDWLRVQALANAIVDLNAHDVSSSQARAAVGLDGAIGRRVTTSIAFLAREPFASIESPGFFDVTRTSFRTGLRYRSPLLDLDRGRPSYYDLSVGGRVVLWRDTLIGFVNFVLPLNDDGFRSGLIPVVGLEAAF